jgi:flagellar motor protein MotB
MSKGIEGNRINFIGYAATRSKADNGTAVGRELNNRVEFSLLPF